MLAQTSSYVEALSIAKELARDAGQILADHMDDDVAVRTKAGGDPVACVDEAIARLTTTRIGEHFPTDRVICEEDEVIRYGPDRVWICDPDDGTVAYINSIPTFTYSLALCVEGQPKVAVACNPLLRRMFSAVDGGEARRDMRVLQVSEAKLDSGVVGVNGFVQEIHAHTYPFVGAAAARGVLMIPVNGAVYASCLVASGKLCGYVNYSVKPYDMAAVALIVTAAGGTVTDLHGRPLMFDRDFTGAIVSNGVVHDDLVAMATS